MTIKPLYVPRTAFEAVTILRKRYQEQCELFPATREIPEAVWIKRNLAAAKLGPWINIEDDVA